MPTLATTRFNRFIDGLSRLYLEARAVQVRLGWEMGRRIVEIEQDGAVRAEYGKDVLRKISEAMTKRHGPGFSDTVLRKMRAFYLQNQKQAAPPKLDWTDHVELLPLKDATLRKRLEKRIIKENLNTRQIRALVRKVRAVPDQPAKPLPPLKHPTDLKLNTYAKSKLGYKLPDGYVLIDCGFTVNWPLHKDQLKNYTVNDTPSYTYEAAIDRVIDGDTLSVVIDLGFPALVFDKLRLRGIDCPELGTPQGEAAKRFVQSLLPAGSTIVIKSHKSRKDTYGRFVVDVLYRPGTEDPNLIIKDPVYLNQQLIDEGYAERMAE